MVQSISDAGLMRRVAATQQTPAPGNTTAAPGARDAMGKDAFLKLLVAQLKYQDPMNPQDSSEFLAQTAQFNMVEKLEELAKQTTELARLSGSQTAAAYLGRQVSYISAEGQPASGVVSGTRLTADGPLLIIGGVNVALSSVTEVRLVQ